MSGSDTALLYNDRAVLENHHISATFRYVARKSHFPGVIVQVEEILTKSKSCLDHIITYARLILSRVSQDKKFFGNAGLFLVHTVIL